MAESAICSYTRIIIAWKVSKLHGYRAENAMKHPMMPTCSRGLESAGILTLQSQLLGGANLAAEAITFTIPRRKTPRLGAAAFQNARQGVVSSRH